MELGISRAGRPNNTPFNSDGGVIPLDGNRKAGRWPRRYSMPVTKRGGGVRVAVAQEGGNLIAGG
jgi:hypothetical protein